MSEFDQNLYDRLTADLEISEIKFSDAKSMTGESRWDSDYYQKHFLKNQKILEGKNSIRFWEMCYSIKKGIFDLSPENYIEAGIPFIRTTEIKEPTIRFSSTVFLDEAVSSENHKTELSPGDLVFTKIGAYIGDVAMLPKTYEKYNFSQNVAGASLKDKKNGAFLLVFFLSLEGRLQILRSAMLSGQGKLELNDIRNYLIPEVSDVFKAAIEELITAKEDLLKLALEKSSYSENLLLEILGIKNLKFNEDLINIINFSKSLEENGRIDSEFYQKKYEDFAEIIKSHPLGFTKVSNEFDLIKTTSKKEKSNYLYVEIGDINIGDGSITPNIVEIEDLPANAKIVAKKGDLIISKVRPNRGAVAIIDLNADDLILSGAFTVLRRKTESKFSTETLKVLLRSKLYKEWMLKFNIGTQYPVELAVQESIQLKSESLRFLEIAKKAMEIALEHNEIEAQKFIKENFDPESLPKH